jgi:hypothetical protein
MDDIPVAPTRGGTVKPCPGKAQGEPPQGNGCPCFTRFLNRDPAVHAARVAGIRSKFTDPVHREKMARVARRNGQKSAADPEHLERLREHGRRLAPLLRTPEALARMAAVRAANGRKVSETRLGWCPPAWRDRYRHLMRSKRLSASSARAQILAAVEKERLTELATFDNLQGAIFHLRRLTPVLRLDHPRGEGAYRVGTAMLEPWQLIKRALDKGWTPCP